MLLHGSEKLSWKILVTVKLTELQGEIINYRRPLQRVATGLVVQLIIPRVRKNCNVYTKLFKARSLTLPRTK